MGQREFRTVSVYYPRGVRTGGPEALHQLVDALRRRGQPALLTPIPGTEHRPRVPEYERYDAPEAAEPADGPDDCIVFPEVWVEPMRLPGPARRLCWWLSVDNSAFLRADLLWRNRRLRAPEASRVRLLREWADELPLRLRARRWVRRVGHLAQSRYARDVLAERFGLSSLPLSDYVVLPDDAPAAAGRSEVPTVSYNAVKGAAHLDRVRAAVPVPVRWLPVVDMTPAQVRTALAGSQVYLDLGHQPGKDRLPREAALLGAVTLVTRVGAGANPEDYPVPDDHRIDVTGEVAGNAAEVLTRVLGDLAGHFARQRPFREALLRERATFEREVVAAFGLAGR